MGGHGTNNSPEYIHKKFQKIILTNNYPKIFANNSQKLYSQIILCEEFSKNTFANNSPKIYSQIILQKKY